MRIITLSVLTLAFSPINLMSAPAPADDYFKPTAEQLAAAKEAYSKLGAKHRYESDLHSFDMPKETIDADLRRLPNLPFRFGLGLARTQVTDAGLKELTEFKNLTSLGLTCTNVTDADLKELRKLKQLTALDLFGTQVTDTGLKELNQFVGMFPHNFNPAM